jgi:hypothetical protein
MFHPIWRLSEAGADNLGVACNEEGLFLGRTPLIERRGGRFVVRDPHDIQRLFCRAYRTEIDARPLIGGLATVAAALNANDLLLARIAAVHLRIPDLPDQAARNAMEAEDRLIKYASREGAAKIGDANWDPALHPRAGAPPNPGWFAPTDGSVGDSARVQLAENEEPTERPNLPAKRDAETRLLRIGARRALRIAILLLMRIASKPGVIVPLAGEVTAMVEVIRTISELKQLAIDADAVLKFAKKGAHTLQELEVSSNTYEEFSTYDQFTKIGQTTDYLEKRFGPAGDGYQYHHIVTQGGANAANIPPEQLHNTENVIQQPTLLHEQVNAEYQRPAEDGSGRTVYEWLQTKSYEFQREYGLKVLRKLHILK